MMVDIELTNNPIQNREDEISNLSSEDKDNNSIINNKLVIEKIKCIVSKLYAILFHIFIFSVFESLFFWYYITKQENKALENQFKDVIMISNFLCLNFDLDLDPVYDYLKDQRVNFNNDVPIHNTFLLNTFLFSFILFLNILMKILKLNLKEENIKTLRNNAFLFLLLFVYEFLFFKNIIYNYKPKSISELTVKIFNQCLNNDND